MPVPGSSRLARQSACLPSSAVKLLGGGPPGTRTQAVLGRVSRSGTGDAVHGQHASRRGAQANLACLLVSIGAIESQSRCIRGSAFDLPGERTVNVDDEGLSPVTHGWLAFQVRPYGSAAAQTPELAVDDPHPGSLTIIVAFIGL
jgi:hypothetical protein